MVYYLSKEVAMGAYTKALSHLTSEEVMERIKSTQGFRNVQRWLVIWNALIEPRPAKDIGKSTGMAEQTVHNIISQYNRNGPKALETPGRGGRKKAYLNLEEERELLKSFETKALTGQVATAKDIKKEIEKKVGHAVHKSTVYRMMRRHGWRKVVPRAAHVKKNAETQKEFKKNSMRKFKRL